LILLGFLKLNTTCYMKSL